MFEKLEKIEKRYCEIEKALNEASLSRRKDDIKWFSRERAQLEELVSTFRTYRKVQADIREAQQLLKEDDEELRDLARAELDTLKTKKLSLKPGCEKCSLQEIQMIQET